MIVADRRPTSPSRSRRFARRFSLWLAAACFAGGLRGSALADTIERRGGEDFLHGRILTIDDAGLTLDPSAGGGSMVVPWDRVRNVEMEFRDPKIARYLPVAADLWRARTRVERGDYTLAEPIFSGYFDRYRGQTSETALVVAEGLLRCRLARQANDQAVVPALEMARLLRARQTTRSYSHLPPLIDDRTSLCTTLAPAFVVNPGLTQLQRELSEYRSPDDPVIAALSGLYRNAVQQLLNTDVTETALARVADHPGVVLLQMLVNANSADSKIRTAAKDRLTSGLEALPAWAVSWAQFAIGQGMLKDTGQGQQQAGLVSMIHVPALYSTQQPYLSGLAMATIADWLQSNGHTESATALRSELQRTYPVHPALAAEVKTSSAKATQPHT